MDPYDRSQDAGNKIKDVLDDAFATILEDGVGQFDRLFSEVNAKFDNMQTEIHGMKQHIASLEDERDGLIQALTGNVESLHSKHSVLEELVQQKMQEVEWRAEQKIEAHMKGLNEQKQRELGKRVLHRLRMKWVFLTFSTWKDKWAAAHAEKMAVQTAAMKFFRTSLVYTFNTWRAHTVGEVKKKAEMSTVANYERIGKIEEAMGLEVEQRHHEIAQVNTVLKHLGLLIDSRDQAEARRRHAEIDRKLRRTMVKISMGALSNCFDAWKECIVEAKEKQQLLIKVRNMMTRRGLTLCFGVWKKWVEIELKDRIEEMRGATAATNFEKISALEKTVEGHKEHLEKLIATKAEDVQSIVTQKFEVQLEAVRTGMSQADAKKKYDLAVKHQRNAFMRMKEKAVVQTFAEWKGHWVDKQVRGHRLQKAMALFTNTQLVWCFRAWQIEWRTASNHRDKQKHTLSVLENYERLRELEQKEEELEAALQAETEQRHFEAEQVSKVLKHLEQVFGTTCSDLHSRQEAHRESIKMAGLRSIAFRVMRNALGAGFQAWRLGAEEMKTERREQAREKNVMEKMFFLMNGNKKGQAFMTWKQAVMRSKDERTHQQIYDLTTLSTKVDKHDRMFITFAKTFRLIPENVSEMMHTQSPQKSPQKGGGGVEEGEPPRGS